MIEPVTIMYSCSSNDTARNSNDTASKNNIHLVVVMYSRT